MLSIFTSVSISVGIALLCRFSVQLLGCVRLQHARPPCPSPTPGVYPNSCSLSRWCHSTVSYSVVPFSSCLPSFPALGSFPMGQFFTSGVGVSETPRYWSFSFSISPSNEYSGLISFIINLFDLLVAQGIIKSFLEHHSSKASILHCSAFFMGQLSYSSWLLEKP